MGEAQRLMILREMESSDFEPALRMGKAPFENPVPRWRHIGMGQVLEPQQRITARVSESVRDTLEQAAELLGAAVNQFVGKRRMWKRSA